MTIEYARVMRPITIADHAGALLIPVTGQDGFPVVLMGERYGDIFSFPVTIGADTVQVGIPLPSDEIEVIPGKVVHV